MPKKDPVEKEFLQLKLKIMALGWARPGSVTRRYMPCGKSSCRCMSTPPQLHGPYYQWSYKVRGKTRSIRLTKHQVVFAKAWAENHKKIKSYLHQIERLALKETDRILASILENGP